MDTEVHSSSDYDIDRYIENASNLLDLEYSFERSEDEARLDAFSPGDDNDNGNTLQGMIFEDMGTPMYGRTLCTFTHRRKTELPSHNITVRDSVVVRLRKSPGVDKLSNTERKALDIEAVVYSLTTGGITLAIDQLELNNYIVNHHVVDIIKVRSDYLYNQYKNTLKSFKKAFNKGDHCSNMILDTVFRNQPPACHQFPPGFQRSLQKHLISSPYHPIKPLNDAQRLAIQQMLSFPSVFCLHGPPGTGKTTTLCEMMSLYASFGLRVLFAASSNIAVDQVIERLNSDYNIVKQYHHHTDDGFDTQPNIDPHHATRSLKVVRIGHPARMLDSVLKSSLDHQVQQRTSHLHSDRKRLHTLTRMVNSTQSNINPSSISSSTGGKGAGSAAASKRYKLTKAEYNEYYSLKRDLSHLEFVAADDSIKDADIVAATLTGVLSKRLQNMEFDVVVLDEAAQSTEPASLGALLKGKMLVLAGDHLQLPPTVLSPEAAEQGLEVTLFERLLRRHQITHPDQHLDAQQRIVLEKNHDGSQQSGYAKILPQWLPFSRDIHLSTILLNEQYRMNIAICNWSSQTFYQGKLVPANSTVAHRNLHEILSQHDPESDAAGLISNIDQETLTIPPEPTIITTKDDLLVPWLTIDTAGDLPEVDGDDAGEESFDLSTSKNSTSKTNIGEIALVQRHIEHLLQQGVPTTNICVLSPYRGQVNLLRAHFNGGSASDNDTSSNLDRTALSRLPSPGKRLSDIEISTIDGAQGREKDVIIISCVRSNPHQVVGFLTEQRRLNVAITRAKRQVVIVADCNTLASDSFLEGIVEYKYASYVHHEDYCDILDGNVSQSKHAASRTANKTPSAKKSNEKRAKLPSLAPLPIRPEVYAALRQIGTAWSQRYTLLQESLNQYNADANTIHPSETNHLIVYEFQTTNPSDSTFPTLNATERKLIHEAADEWVANQKQSAAYDPMHEYNFKILHESATMSAAQSDPENTLTTSSPSQDEQPNDPRVLKTMCVRIQASRKQLVKKPKESSVKPITLGNGDKQTNVAEAWVTSDADTKAIFSTDAESLQTTSPISHARTSDDPEPKALTSSQSTAIDEDEEEDEPIPETPLRSYDLAWGKERLTGHIYPSHIARIRTASNNSKSKSKAKTKGQLKPTVELLSPVSIAQILNGVDLDMACITLPVLQLSIEDFTGVPVDKQKVMSRSRLLKTDEDVGRAFAPLPGVMAGRVSSSSSSSSSHALPMLVVMGAASITPQYGPLAEQTAQDEKKGTAHPGSDPDSHQQSRVKAPASTHRPTEQTSQRSELEKKPSSTKTQPPTQMKPGKSTDAKAPGGKKMGQPPPSKPPGRVGTQPSPSPAPVTPSPLDKTSQRLAEMVYGSRLAPQAPPAQEAVMESTDLQQTSKSKKKDSLDDMLDELRVGKCFVSACSKPLSHIPRSCSACRNSFCYLHAHPLQHGCTMDARPSISTTKPKTDRENELLRKKLEAAKKNKNLGGSRQSTTDDSKKKK